MRVARIFLVVLMAAGAVPAAGHAQDAAQRIAAARARADAAGIPVALLDSKVAEGRAKGVPADRIAAAVERRLAALSQARDAMGGARISAADLAVGGDAIEAGVEPAVLGRLASGAPAEARAVAIAVLTQLVRDGLASERALARVEAALARGPEALRRLPGEVSAERGNRAGAPGQDRGPGDAARGRGRGQGGPPAAIPGPTNRPERGKGRENPKGRP